MSFAALAGPLLALSLAQSPESILASPAKEPPVLVAAAWCPMLRSAPEEGAPGCDMGLGVAVHRFQRFPRLGIAAGVGTKTVGAGLSWTFGRMGERPLALSLGPVAPYDKHGIHVDRWALAVGATFGFGGSK